MATTKLSHPFLHEMKLPALPPDQSKMVDEIYEWIKQQPTFPTFSKLHARQFLHACLWNVKDTRKSLQRYCQIRAGAPDIFANRDPLLAPIQNVLDIAHMVGMPKLTPEGYQILVYRLADTEPSKLQFTEAVKMFCMFNDYRISCDGLAEGYVVLFDMKGVRLGHLTRVQLGALRTFMVYIQEAHPVRLKKVYVVHTAGFINQVMALVKPLVRTEMMALLKFTSQGPIDILDKDLLPSDYGGTLGSIQSYYEAERHTIETEYRDWLIDSGNLKDMGKGSAQQQKHAEKETAPLTTTFGRLEID